MFNCLTISNSYPRIEHEARIFLLFIRLSLRSSRRSWRKVRGSIQINPHDVESRDVGYLNVQVLASSMKLKFWSKQQKWPKASDVFILILVANCLMNFVHFLPKKTCPNLWPFLEGREENYKAMMEKFAQKSKACGANHEMRKRWRAHMSYVYCIPDIFEILSQQCDFASVSTHSTINISSNEDLEQGMTKLEAENKQLLERISSSARTQNLICRIETCYSSQVQCWWFPKCSVTEASWK